MGTGSSVVFPRKPPVGKFLFVGKAYEAFHSYNYHEEDTLFKVSFVEKCFLLVSVLKLSISTQQVASCPCARSKKPAENVNV